MATRPVTPSPACRETLHTTSAFPVCAHVSCSRPCDCRVHTHTPERERDQGQSERNRGTCREWLAGTAGRAPGGRAPGGRAGQSPCGGAIGGTALPCLPNAGLPCPPESFTSGTPPVSQFPAAPRPLSLRCRPSTQQGTSRTWSGLPWAPGSRPNLGLPHTRPGALLPPLSLLPLQTGTLAGCQTRTRPSRT